MAELRVCRSCIVLSVLLVLQSYVTPSFCAPPSSATVGSFNARGGTPVAPLAKRYTVNLDLPPEQRWVEVVRDHEQSLTQLIQMVKSSLPSKVASLVAKFGDDVNKYMPSPYGAEMVGIANAVNITVSDVILGNVLYELTAYGSKRSDRSTPKMCTSIVAQTINGTIYHGRNLDYSFPDLLRDLTIIVDFVQDGNTVYTGTTFAGIVGLYTGQKPNAYTVSVDQRNQGYWWMNALEALLAGTHGITSLKIRDAVADKEMSFETVVDFLVTGRLIAPSYIIVGGTKAGEGVVITRDRMTTKDLWRLDPDNGRWYLVETNYDHWQPPPTSDDRRNPAIKAMDETTRGGLNATSLFKVMSTPPVLNRGTTYTVVMSAAMPEIYNSWIRSDVLQH